MISYVQMFWGMWGFWDVPEKFNLICDDASGAAAAAAAETHDVGG